VQQPCRQVRSVDRTARPEPDQVLLDRRYLAWWFAANPDRQTLRQRKQRICTHGRTFDCTEATKLFPVRRFVHGSARALYHYDIAGPSAKPLSHYQENRPFVSAAMPLTSHRVVCARMPCSKETSQYDATAASASRQSMTVIIAAAAPLRQFTTCFLANVKFVPRRRTKLDA